ncbi:MAG: 16S rRNA pseudouridine(516) synthase, partial [Hungatella sp.]
AVLTILEVKENASSQTTVLLTIQEGKFHQVKRMFEALDCQVLYLKRKSMGCLLLDETLAPGEYRMLREDEILQLQQLT